jgi:hypothetical protein
MKYTVQITSKMTQIADVSVETETEEEAKDKAEALTDDPNFKGWELYDYDCTYDVVID